MTRFALLALLFPASALAFQVEWDTPERCPAPALAPSGDGRAEVIVREKAGAWSATVLFFEPTVGLRRVNAASCEEALKAAQLIIGLGAHDGSPPPLPKPVAPESAPVAEPWFLSLGAGAALDVGSLPQAEPRAVVAVSALVGALRVALDARVGFPATLSASARAQRLIELQLAGCVHARVGAFSGGPCLALAGGSWRVTAANAVAETFALSTSAQLRASVVIVAGLEVAALAGLRLNVRRPAPFDAAGEVFTTPLLASEFQLTTGWRW